MKSKTCTDDVDKKKEIYDIVFAIINSIENITFLKPQVARLTSGKKVGAQLTKIIHSYAKEKKNTLLKICLGYIRDEKEHEMLLHLLRCYFEQSEPKICYELGLALNDPKILKQFIE